MKKLTIEEQKTALNNFLKTVSNNEKLFVYSVNIGKNTRFAIAEKTPQNAIQTHSNFMNYHEMNCYLFGVLAVQQNKIDFKN